jgi:hypothetical protein
VLHRAAQRPATTEPISTMFADDDFRTLWEAHDVRPTRDGAQPQPVRSSGTVTPAGTRTGAA